MRISRFIFLFASLVAVCHFSQAQAQSLQDSVAIARDSVVANAVTTRAANDSLAASVDSLGTPVIDPGLSEYVPDEIDSIQVVKSTLERPAFSSAKDSVIEDMRNGRNIIYYYGDVSVTYGDLEISSDFMAYDVDNNIVFARGTKDYDGNWVGQPKMTNGGNEYTMEEVYYNFNSKKAKIKNMITNQKEGELRGENLKMLPDESINIAGGIYTVCDAEHPHYYMKMTAAKITGNSKKTVFGPAYVVVEDVPLPIVLPFGFVPEMPERASGILVPTFGEENARGLYMRGLGYYFVVGDHFDVSLSGDIYSYGSWAAQLGTRYKKRYAFDGSLNMNYSVDITGEPDAPDYKESRNFGLSWSHSQDPKARPGTSFRASVNFSSPKNNTYNSTSIADAVQNQTSSSISYSKTFSFGSLSINALHSQNSRDSSYSITFPNLTFNVNRFYPFKRKVRAGKEKFYEQISLSYNTTLQNKIAFKASEIHDPGLINKMNNGMTHNFAIGLPQFTLLKFFNFSPSITYGMNWYFRENLRVYDPEAEKVVSQMTDLFSAFGISQTYSGGISMSTRLYGMFNFNPKGKLQAIRHMITPSFSFSFRPELGTPANGYTTLKYINSKGEEVVEEYNKYNGMLYSPPGKGKSASLSFSFGNNLEAKIKDPTDSTGVKTTKIKLIDQLNLNGSYNFLADSLKLSNISISGSTTVFGKLGINGNMTLDPYAIDERGVRINTLNIFKEKGFRIARLTNASASLSYSFSGEGHIEGNDGKSEADPTSSPDYYRVYYHPVTGEYIPGGWLYYLNPSSPWSVNLNANFAYTASYKSVNGMVQKVNSFTSTISASAQLKLTKALNFSLNTGFDLTKMALTTTQLSATYDLHCFNISVSWVPQGTWESWSFRIAANASALADLLQFKKASSYWDR